MKVQGMLVGSVMAVPGHVPTWHHRGGPRLALIWQGQLLTTAGWKPHNPGLVWLKSCCPALWTLSAQQKRRKCETDRSVATFDQGCDNFVAEAAGVWCVSG